MKNLFALCILLSLAFSSHSYGAETQPTELTIKLTIFRTLNWPVLANPDYYFATQETAELSIGCGHDITFTPTMTVVLAGKLIALSNPESEAACIATVHPQSDLVKGGNVVNLKLSALDSDGRYGKIEFAGPNPGCQ